MLSCPNFPGHPRFPSCPPPPPPSPLPGAHPKHVCTHQVSLGVWWTYCWMGSSKLMRPAVDVTLPSMLPVPEGPAASCLPISVIMSGPHRHELLPSGSLPLLLSLLRRLSLHLNSQQGSHQGSIEIWMACMRHIGYEMNLQDEVHACSHPWLW